MAKQKIVNWFNLFKEHKGEWVALKDDEETVVASGKSAQTVYKEARNRGVKIPIMYRVPTVSAPYIGNVQ